MDKLIILGRGINGSTSYSIFQDNPRKAIITNKDLEKISKEFVRLYPEIARKIKNYEQTDFASGIPEEIILNLQPTEKFNFLETVSEKVK